MQGYAATAQPEEKQCISCMIMKDEGAVHGSRDGGRSQFGNADCAWQKPEEKQCISCMIMKTKEQFTEAGWRQVAIRKCK